MRQRRKLARRHLLYYLQVIDRDTQEPAGRLGDVSTEGLMLLCQGAPVVGRLYRLGVVPPEDAPSTTPINVDAECLWVRPDANPDIRLAGFRFTEVEDVALATIERLVREYGFADGQFVLDDE